MIHHRERIGIELNEQPKPRGVIKRCNRDFIVREITTKGALPLLGHTTLSRSYDKDAYVLFNMTKQGITSNDAVFEVARQLHVRVKDVTMHGMKDRWAITSQLIAIRSDVLSKERRFNHHSIYVRDIGTVSQPLRIGGNKGNRFWIRVRRCYTWPDLADVHAVPNFFGGQRFGRLGDEQHVGRLLLTGNAEEAGYRITFPPLRWRLEQALSECNGNHRQAFLHPMMQEVSKFSVLQWQSYLFNRLVSAHIQSGLHLPETFPFWCNKHSALYQGVWESAESIEKEFERMAARTQRRTMVSPRNFTFRNERDQSVVFEFELPSGSYATVVLGQLYELVEKEHGG